MTEVKSGIMKGGVNTSNRKLAGRSALEIDNDQSKTKKKKWRKGIPASKAATTLMILGSIFISLGITLFIVGATEGATLPIVGIAALGLGFILFLIGFIRLILDKTR